MSNSLKLDERRASRRWRWITTAAIAVMLSYFTVTNHVDLYPWSNLQDAGSQFSSTLTGLIPFGIYAIAFAAGFRWLMLVGTVHSWIWLALQLRQWWLPYLFGETFLHDSFAWYVDNGYDETTSFLPERGDRPVPDAQHVVLEILSLLVAVSATVALVRAWREARSPAQVQVSRWPVARW